jgi:tRNA pseudouridine38-40 synthase
VSGQLERLPGELDDGSVAPAAEPRGICLRLAYAGTRYSGWQAQPGRMTVQGTLAAAITAISGETIMPRGTSRTDSGVHAFDQIVAFTTTSPLAPGVWLKALNAHLPADISVTAACATPADFDPFAVAVRKRYRYRVHDAIAKPVLTGHEVWRWRGRLACERMHEAAAALVGRHDFTSFEATPSTRRSKVRTIHALEVRRAAGAEGGDSAMVSKAWSEVWPEVWIEVEGDGFLHNMVRIIAGSLVMVGAGRRPPEWLAEALAARSRPAAGPTAPPQGLVLLRTVLEPDPFALPPDLPALSS